MRYVLFPNEEKQLFAYLTEELSLRPLDTPLEDTLEDFPFRTSVANNGMICELFFLCESVGPLRRLGDITEPRDVKESVMIQVNKEVSEQWASFIDLSRTPHLKWQRPAWLTTDKSCLIAGRLGSMTINVKDYPTEMRRIYNKVDRWLKKSSKRYDPFDYVDSIPVQRPRNTASCTVCAWPEGSRWVADGGQLWPWDG
jgi:hypothetical protein